MRQTRSIRGMIKKLEKIKTNIGKERDKLREVIDEYEDLVNDADVAYCCLEEAIDKLSEQC